MPTYILYRGEGSLWKKLHDFENFQKFLLVQNQNLRRGGFFFFEKFLLVQNQNLRGGGRSKIFFEKCSDLVEITTIRRRIARRTTLWSLTTHENVS